MQTEKLKWKTHEGESTEAVHRGGVTRSSEERSVMERERRGDPVRLSLRVNRQREEPLEKAQPLRLDGKSRMSREVHVRFREGVGVRLPRATRLVVLCNGTKAQALEMKEELKGVLETLGLKLSEEKTKVTHITEGFTFLGYQIIKAIGTRGEMVLKVLIPEDAIKRYRYKVREITAPRTTGESTRAKIMALNQLTRGWCQYYSITSSPSEVFNRLNHELFWEMAHWLGRKYKAGIPTIMQRFRKGNTLGTKSIKLEMPQDQKARKRLVKAWHNPYTEKEEIKREKNRIKRESLFSYDQILTGDHDRPGGMDLREEVLLRDGPVCIKCGNTFHPSELQMDHIKARARFKDPREADSMDNLQLLCTPCHRAKTQTDLKVLSRMR